MKQLGISRLQIPEGDNLLCLNIESLLNEKYYLTKKWVG